MYTQVEVDELYKIAYEIRKNLVFLASRKTIHIGGALSATDILTVLWQHVLHYNCVDPFDDTRDRFILSKGHCAAAVALNQAIKGCFSIREVLNEYATENCRFNMAPCRHRNPFYESSATGSLGQGLSIGTGMAMALQMKNNISSKVYVMAGDGELQEGSNWEAIMYAAQLQLKNLILIIDNNGLQFDGETEKIVSLGRLSDKFTSFGWTTIEVDGHNIQELLEAFEQARKTERPVVVNAHTIKGKGISYMENNYKWHAGKIAPEMLQQTLDELAKSQRAIYHV